MSTVVMSACWPLTMPPTPKAVLISLADNANDHGECWPSIPKIAERTCFTERTVQRAIGWLESEGLLVADRSNGRHTRYRVTPPTLLQMPANPRQRVAPVRESPASETEKPPSESRKPPSQSPSNRKEPSIEATKSKSRRASAPPPPKPDDVDDQTWLDWLVLRKAKNAPVTATVVKQARAEAGKAGMGFTRFLEIWCARGSQGLEAEWLKPKERKGATDANNHRLSAAERVRANAVAGDRADRAAGIDPDRQPHAVGAHG